jgi:hypothetical protein
MGRAPLVVPISYRSRAARVYAFRWSVGLEKSWGRRTHNEASLSHQRCSDPFARQQHIPNTNPQRMGHGEGQVVLLSGEPGIRKSRVLTTLRERLEAQGALPLRFQCSPYLCQQRLLADHRQFRTDLFHPDTKP